MSSMSYDTHTAIGRLQDKERPVLDHLVDPINDCRLTDRNERAPFLAIGFLLLNTIPGMPKMNPLIVTFRTKCSRSTLTGHTMGRLLCTSGICVYGSGRVMSGSSVFSIPRLIDPVISCAVTRFQRDHVFRLCVVERDHWTAAKRTALGGKDMTMEVIDFGYLCLREPEDLLVISAGSVGDR